MGVVILLFLVIWFFFFRSSSPSATTGGGSFSTSVNNTTNIATNSSGTNNVQTIASSGQISPQKIFEIAQGPIAGATLIQTLHPTTTLARYINQEDGHVYDLPLDVAGAVPHVVSNVTIPGAAHALWLEQGNAAILQYLDGSTVKSVYLGLPPATTSTKIVPTRIQFLPDNIADIAASPDGASVAYMFKTQGGVDGYTARSDGTGAKKIFSLPLSQVLISWPAQGSLLIESKPAAGVPGIVFAIDAKSGVVTPLLYVRGITATTNTSFSTMLYQIADGSTLATYIHDVKSGLEAPLPISPAPEQCIWSRLNTALAFCAASIQAVPANYLDLWHQGLGGSAENIFKVFTNIGSVSVVASPGSGDGGVPSDILEMALSPDEHYLSFTTKGVRALWGVRLTQ